MEMEQTIVRLVTKKKKKEVEREREREREREEMKKVTERKLEPSEAEKGSNQATADARLKATKEMTAKPRRTPF
jgi:16S rRNA C1402 N4-methylase RsmH